VYILRCADDTLYTGCTNDLSRRLRSHERGRVKYTRGRLPVALAYSEPAESHGAALRREAALKRLSRAHKLKLISASPAPPDPKASRGSSPPQAQPGNGLRSQRKTPRSQRPSRSQR
jgi:putative endonuclease